MQSVYPNLKLPEFKDKPFYYSNFVSTIDGRVQVLENTDAYWPLGSEFDYKTLIELRTYADVLIHGKNTALPHPTLHSLTKETFWKLRKKKGNDKPITYIVISNHPTDKLIPKLYSTNAKVKTLLITNESVDISKKLSKATGVVRLGTNSVDLTMLSDFLYKRGLRRALVEGGPTLMGQFIKHELINEIFLTITPKITGSKDNTLSMVEGVLLDPKRVQNFELLSVKNVNSELYLRYKIRD